MNAPLIELYVQPVLLLPICMPSVCVISLFRDGFWLQIAVTFCLWAFSRYICVLSLHKGLARTTRELRPQDSLPTIMDRRWCINTPAFSPLQWANSEACPMVSHWLKRWSPWCAAPSLSFLHFPIGASYELLSLKFLSQDLFLRGPKLRQWCYSASYQRKLRLLIICILLQKNWTRLSEETICLNQVLSSSWCLSKQMPK